MRLLVLEDEPVFFRQTLERLAGQLVHACGVAVGLAIVGWIQPTMIPLCFAPEEAGEAVVVCPTAQSAPFSTSGTDSGTLGADLGCLLGSCVDVQATSSHGSSGALA